MRCSLKILQDTTKQQVTNLSLPGDTERITAANLCWTVPEFWRVKEGKAASLSLSKPSPFLFPLSATQRAENLKVSTPGNILTGDQFAQAALVWITLSIRSHRVYHHMHYCRGWSDHCVEVCLSRGRKGWNKCPRSEATVGQSAGLIWKDSCNYESLEVTAVWQIQCANTRLTVRRVHYNPPHPPKNTTHTKHKMLGQ